MMTKGLVKMSLETKTEFMGASCDGSIKSGTIAKALVASSDKKLNVQEYVDSSGFKIDKLMFNEFWQVVAKKQGTHVGTLMLNWLGYEGTNKTQKQKFTDYLKRQAIPFEELSSSDERVRLFPSMLKEIKEITTNNIERVKFLLMNSRDFKKAIMKLSTKKGNDIREYYLNVEELLQEYVEYEHRFVRKREEEAKVVIKQKDDKIDELLRKVDDQNRKIDQLLDDNVNAAIEHADRSKQRLATRRHHDRKTIRSGVRRSRSSASQSDQTRTIPVYSMDQPQLP
jgi:Mor family transcriptional regulator